MEGIINNQSKILLAHQKFTEDLDSDKPAHHLIVLSLKEDRDHGDDKKFLEILNAIQRRERTLK